MEEVLILTFPFTHNQHLGPGKVSYSCDALIFLRCLKLWGLQLKFLLPSLECPHTLISHGSMDKKKHEKLYKLCWKAGFLSAVHPRRLRTSGMLATGAGFSGSSLDFAPLFARTWSWPGSSSNYSWIGHAHDSGFFLAVTWKTSHWRISMAHLH